MCKELWMQKTEQKMRTEFFDGEIKTACQQTCPTEAIVFGNAMDQKSQVAERKKDIRGYHQLEELNFQPGVTYLSKIERN